MSAEPSLSSRLPCLPHLPHLPQEVLDLPWNTARRAIDPTLIVAPDGRLHCFFVGSANLFVKGAPKKRRANLLG